MLTRRDALTRAGVLGAAALAGLGPASAKAQGGRKSALTIALPSNPETVDPHQFRSVLTGSILTNVCETLVVRDARTMELKPLLATSWRNVNPTTWEFKLRQGVKFHNGEPFDGASVKFSIERIIGSKLNTLGKVLWPPSIGQDVQIVDPFTVRITTKVPDPILPNRVAAESVSMVPPKAMAEYREKFLGDRPIGSGPYRFVEYVVGDRLVVEANPDYWGPKPATGRIVWQIIADAATRVAALTRGTVDVMVNLPVPLISTVESDPKLAVYSELGSSVHLLLLNANQSPVLKDRRVRQALAYAIDRPTILKSLYAGRGKLTNSVVAHQVTNAIDPGPYAYDPERAKKLLAEAGQRGGFDLALWQATGRWSQAEEAAQLIAGYWEKIGARVSLQTLEWGEYNRRAGRGLHKDAGYYAFVNGTWDPSYLTQRFLPTYGSFRYFDATGDLKRVIEEHERAFEPAKRRELAAQVQKGLHEEVGWLYLWQLDEIFGMSRNVKSFRMRPDHILWTREAYVEA
jgi:peptide/nickel transport system substrate-binding protein